MANADNVIQFPSNYAIFNAQIRKNIADGITAAISNEKKEETVMRFEQVLCTELVRALRTSLVRLATKAGERLGKKIVGE